jgi:hypothetical protein
LLNEQSLLSVDRKTEAESLRRDEGELKEISNEQMFLKRPERYF